MTVQLFNNMMLLSSILKISTKIDSVLPKPSIYTMPLYSNNYILKHHYYNTEFIKNIEYHNLKCWKSNCIFQYYLDDDYVNTVFKVDFSINREDKNNTFIKIDYLYINNDFYDKLYKLNTGLVLKDEETLLLKHSIFKFIENWATRRNIDKIVIDIHTNLLRYNSELKDLGFVVTDTPSILNVNWVEAVKILNYNT